jgi:hypothetical protein
MTLSHSFQTAACNSGSRHKLLRNRLVYLWTRKPCFMHTTKLHILPSKTSSLSKQRVVPIDPSWIELGRIKKWMAYCDFNHGGKCHHVPEFQATTQPPTLTLIDTASSCLVQTTVSVQYLALSYVWGQDRSSLDLRRDNAQELFCSGSLVQSRNLANLPRTIKDAIALTRSLGLRYLWVDCLCIVYTPYAFICVHPADDSFQDPRRPRRRD